MDKLRIKIRVPDVKQVERNTEQSKRLKDDGEYTDMGWRVLAVPFGGPVSGRDLDGEAFHEGTDIFLKVGDRVNLTYYHGYGPDSPDEIQVSPAIIGRATYDGAEERGHWFRVYLDEGEPLANRLIEAGVESLRASSGAVGHLVRMGKAGMIDVWPVGEIALFDINEWRIPANDFAVIEAKAVQVAEASPETAEAVVTADNEPVAAKTKTTTIIPQEELTMIDQIENVEKKEPVEQAEIKSFMEEQKKENAEFQKSVLDLLKEREPGVEKGAPVVTKGNPKESASFAKAFMAWAKGDNPKGFDGDAIELKGAWQGQTDNEGGYAVPDGFYNRIVEQRQEMSWVRQAPVMRMTTDRDRILVPVEATAGTKLVVTAEEAGYDENEPVFGQVAVTIHKFTKMIKVSEELLSGDAVGLEAYIASVVARASAAAENYYCAIGAGGGAPQGVVTGATASGITTAAAGAITAAELIQLMGKVETPYHNASSGFLMKGATKFYLQALTGNPFQFIQTPSGGDFLGYPGFVAPDMDAIGASAKSVIFGDFSMYAFAERQGLTVSRNPYLYQANGQVGIFVSQRFGGAVLQTLAFKYLTQHA